MSVAGLNVFHELIDPLTLPSPGGRGEKRRALPEGERKKEKALPGRKGQLPGRKGENDTDVPEDREEIVQEGNR